MVPRNVFWQKLGGPRRPRRDRTVDVFVRKLREKIDRRAGRHSFIQTRYGVGYKLEPVAKSLEAPDPRTSTRPSPPGNPRARAPG